MTKKELKDKIESITDPDARARFVNGIKAAAEGTEYWCLVQLEYDDYIEQVNDVLEVTPDQQVLLTLAVRKQGASAVQKRVLEPWRIEGDKDVGSRENPTTGAGTE